MDCEGWSEELGVGGNGICLLGEPNHQELSETFHGHGDGIRCLGIAVSFSVLKTCTQLLHRHSHISYSSLFEHPFQAMSSCLWHGILQERKQTC